MESTRFVTRRVLGAILLAGALVMAAACGRQDEVAGGGPSVATSHAREWEGRRVTVNPATASLTTGGTQQFTATVSGTWHKDVTWSVQEGDAGGTITSDGLYAAPSTAGTYHVVATNSATETSGTATVTVTAPPPTVSVAVSPATATLTTGGTQQFSAMVSGITDQTVTWSVQEGAAGGTVTSNGLYTASSTPGTYHVVATSPTTGTSGAAPVTVTATGTGWILQTSGTTNGLTGVSFVDANTGTAVGDNGTILHTSDGGSTWTAQTSGTTNNLFAVSFADASSGTAVGDNGTILHTTDGGRTWTAQTSGTTNGLYGVSFVDASTGTAVGLGGTIVHTADGGNTWTAQTSGTFAELIGVSFVDRNTGTAVGGDGVDAAIILHTADGGTTWAPQAAGAFPQVGLAGVSFVDANTGMAVGTYFCSDACGDTWAVTLRTTDGGATWSEGNDNEIGALVYAADLGVSSTGSQLSSVSLQDANTATAVGMRWDDGCGCYFGLIVRTADGGASWALQDGSNQVDWGFAGVSFVGAEIGTIVGGLGSIQRTTTGGQ
jgi:photosystem II stability/assembly factor-like uncharacterized protein